MRRGLRCAGVLLAMTLTTAVLAGCSSEDEPEAAPGEPTTSAESEPAETEEPEPEPEPIDPCTLLTAEDIEAAGVRADYEKSNRSLLPDSRTQTCVVPHPQEGWAIYYGFSTKPNVSADEAVTQLATEDTVVIDAGDRARMGLYDAYDDKTWHAWASRGRYSVMVELFEKPRPARVAQLLDRMLEQVDPTMFEFPIDLPEGCPSARSKPITRLVGEVTHATGLERDGDVSCTYANRRGLTAGLTSTALQSAAKARASIGRVAEYYDERSTPAPGVTLLVSPGDGYAYAGAYTLRPPSQRGTDLQQITLLGSSYRPLEYDRQAYRDLSAWWATQR